MDRFACKGVQNSARSDSIQSTAEQMPAGKKNTGAIRERDYAMDNIRFILIFLVVFAHLLELFSGKCKSAMDLYIVIYSFHMPCFLFITGWFARFRLKKLLRSLVLPYLVFQTLYLLFDYFVLENQENGFSLQYTTPYWLLWYLLAVIFYYLLLPVLKTQSKKKAAAVIVLLAALSIAAGFVSSIGRWLSLSRAIVFFPFFMSGYYLSNTFDPVRIRTIFRKYKARLIVFSAAVMAACECYFLKTGIHRSAFFGSFPYESSGTNAGVRLLIGICAVCAILLLLLIVPNRKLGLLTFIGQNTMAVYLLHGFIQRLLLKNQVMQFSLQADLGLALLLTCLILFALGNKYVGHLFRKIF